MASDHSPGPACRTVFERSSPDKVSCAKAGLEFRKEAVSTAITKRWIDNTHPTNFFTCKTARADRFDPAMQNKHENIQSLPQSNALARNRAMFFVFIQEIFTQVEITIPEGSHRPETQRNRDLFVLRL